MYFLPYNRNLKEFSRQLRNKSTLSEVILWQKLRASQVNGYQFNRQKPLGRYIVDFYCKNLSLVIEVDGSSHFVGDAPIRDKERQDILESMGLQFLRFDDEDVKQNISFVMRVIYEFIEDRERSNPLSPLKRANDS
ncbi:MAG: endonuclease domain-containing protein [Cytophagia bacterium]|nr:endonuclease domain-containing protein [Cytophagia bacterium]